MKKSYNFFKRFTSANGLLKKSFAFASLILLGTGAAFAQSSNPIGFPGLAGDFEVDADYTANTCPTPNCVANGTDWKLVLTPDPDHPGFVLPGISTVVGENAKWVVDGNSGSGAIISNDEIETFAGTSNKNGDFVTIGASPYSIDTSNPGAPQKNDLTNIYVRSKIINGDTWLVMGAETRSVDGTNYLDFEYNAAGMFKTATQMFGPDSLASTGGRTARNTSVNPATAGDALFVVDFSKGGGVPIPKVFEWRAVTKGNKTSYGWVEIPIPAGLAFIVTNGADVTAPGFNTAFAGDGSASGTTEALQFVEMGVNLTDLFGNFNPCAPEATMLVKTRTSSSYTSELKDFSLFDFTLVDLADIADIADISVCPSTDTAFRAVVSGPGAAPGNVHFFKVLTPDDPATTQVDEEQLSPEIVTGGRIVVSTEGAATRVLRINDVIAADTGLYKATLSGSTCGAVPKYFRLNLNSVDAPIITLLEPSVCFARAKGLLTVCNPQEGADYDLDQLDENGDPIPGYHQDVTYASGALTFDLEPGYIFTLTVDKDGCTETVDCDNLASECPSTLAPTSAPKKPKNGKVKQGNETPVDNSDLGQDKVQNQTLSAYPVPFSDKVTVKFTAEKSESYVINLYNMHGKLIKELKSGNAKAGDVIKMEISGKGMVESLYVVKKISKSGISTVKLFKQE